MAIEHSIYHETHNLAHAEKTFYPLRIPVSHWQLRHYISTPEPDLLYYASGNQIYCLNTTSKKRKHIATLPFEARCTASGYGWVCVGGEKEGHFAAIKLDGGADSRTRIPGDASEEHWGGRKATSVRLETMGEDIVNSISIHRIQDEEMHLDDIVAVLTNNDKTVRIYSLPQNMETHVLDLDFPINHATVSPDGQTLLAVGDYNQAYFYRRHIAQTPPQIHKPHNRLTSASLTWRRRTTIKLHVSRGPNSSAGYFTTAWSPNGQLVAVGSEGGYITVFDINLLPTTDDPPSGMEGIVAVVPSSRPDWNNPHPGAVRSMVFSPEPWDLLIWAEDQDRVCIGDLRTGLKSRQIIQLDPKEEGLNTIPVQDLPGDEAIDVSASTPSPPPPLSSAAARDLDELEAEFIRRYRQLPDSQGAFNFTTEYIDARRRQRLQRHDATTATLRSFTENSSGRDRASNNQDQALEDDPQGLTAGEQQILESLRTTRQREEARVAAAAAGGGNSMPRSVNYTSSDNFREASGNRSTPTTAELSRTQRPASSHGPQSPAGLPSWSDLQEAGWSNSPRSRVSSSLIRLSDGSRLPRRRASVILTSPETNSPSPAAGSTSLVSSSAAAERGTAATDPAGDENPWQTIEEHMTLARGPLFEQRLAQQQQQNATSSSSSSSSPTVQPLPANYTQEELGAHIMLLEQQNQQQRRRQAQAQLQQQLALQRQQQQRDPAGPSNTAAAAAGGGLSRLPTFAQQGGDILLRRAAGGVQASALRSMPPGYLREMAAGREIGVRTAGLAISSDGRFLWAACEEGIFEIRVGVKARFFWPSLEMR